MVAVLNGMDYFAKLKVTDELRSDKTFWKIYVDAVPEPKITSK